MQEPITVYIVGKFGGHTSEGIIWDFQGVFASEQDALAACVRKDFFYAPAIVGEKLPIEATEWPGCQYPHGTFESESDYEAWKATGEAKQ